MKQKIAKPRKFRQNQVDRHYHPRWLARKIVHSQMEAAGATGVNSVAPGVTQSMFAQRWRDEAESFAR